MEQTSFSVIRGRHSGWSEEENKLLWETADEAQQQGLPLKQVFERIAAQTGRRPNSIRNYYYAQVRAREGVPAPMPRFVPFEEEEVEALVEKAGGIVSGRCAILAEGDAQAREDLVYLEKLPLFNAEGKIIG